MRTFSAEELSSETGLPVDRLGLADQDRDPQASCAGRFGPGDAIRAKMMSALLEAGFSQEQIEWAVLEALSTSTTSTST